jgi:CRP/FNR family transcriptional regulator, cyclic AMP receptor protein
MRKRDMSELLARTLARALPLFARRWQDAAREMESVQEMLMTAVRSDTARERTAPPLPIIDALDRAAGIVPFVTTSYEPGQPICTREDRDPILYCVRSGHIRLTEPLPDGRMVTLSILQAGDLFGAVDALARYGVSAEAMTHSDVTLLHASQLPAVVRITPEAVHAIVAALAAQLRDAHLLVAHALAHDTSIRLVTMLLALADAFGEAADGGKTLITYPTTHQELADMIGANRVTVTRKLIELQKAAFILPERRNMLLVDIPGLTALLGK